MSHSTSLVVSTTILFKAMNKIISQQRRLAIFSSYFCKNDFKRKLTYVFFLHASANTRVMLLARTKIFNPITISDCKTRENKQTRPKQLRADLLTISTH